MKTAGCLLLGIDVGTTLTKAGVVDDAGRELCRAEGATPWRHTAAGTDLDADELLTIVVDVAGRALAKAPPGDVAGVGITSIAETVILLDARAEAIGHAPAWHDRRAREDWAAYRDALGDERIGAITGLATAQMPTLPMLRHRFLREPEARRAMHALSVAEWVAFRLGGEIAAEASLATRTGALDVARRAWWPEALSWAGARADLFPPVRAAGSALGRVPASLGLTRATGAVVTVGGHDHLCAAVGIGAVAAHQAVDSCGTAEGLLRAVPRDPSRPLGAGRALGIAIGCHALEGYDALLGGTALGLVFGPVLDFLGASSASGVTPFDDAALALAPEIPSRPAEEDDAQWAVAARAAGAAPVAIWHGTVARATARARALLSGLEALGGPIEEVRLIGGWASNPVLRRLKAECFPPLTIPAVAEAGIRGAALFAGMAYGRFASPADFPPVEVEPIAPEPLSESILPVN